MNGEPPQVWLTIQERVDTFDDVLVFIAQQIANEKLDDTSLRVAITAIQYHDAVEGTKDGYHVSLVGPRKPAAPVLPSHSSIPVPTLPPPPPPART